MGKSGRAHTGDWPRDMNTRLAFRAAAAFAVLVTLAAALDGEVSPVVDASLAKEEEREAQAIINAPMPESEAMLGESLSTGKETTSDLEAKQKVLDDKLRQATAEHTTANAISNAQKAQRETVRADTLKKAEAQETASDTINMQAQLAAKDIPKTPEGQVEAMEGFQDDISKMKASLTKVEAETDEAAANDQGPSFKEQVQEELKKVDAKAELRRKANDVKLQGQMRLVTKKAELEAEKAKVESEERDAQNAQQEEKMKEKVQEQVNASKDEAAVAKAKNDEEEKMRL